MQSSRRDFLKQVTITGLAAGVSASELFSVEKEPHRKLGIAISSYAIRSRSFRKQGFRDPIRFVDFCHQRGAGGVQLPIGARDKDYARKLRKSIEKIGMFLEASMSTPRKKSDVERFEAEVKTAKAAGATIIRTVCLGGRRYETFKKASEFTAFKKHSLERLRMAEPIVARHKMRLAIENHKDFRTDELLGMLKRIDSQQVGICVDTGNNLALLEDPLEMTRAMAPLAFACHLKDMGVEESTDGFLLSEVPLGTGSLDLQGIVTTLRKANSKIQFTLEMITRDPLRIPCLSEGYWETMQHVSGKDLARTLTWVRKHRRKTSLPRITKLTQEKKLAIEEANVRQSLQFAKAKLS